VLLCLSHNLTAAVKDQRPAGTGTLIERKNELIRAGLEV
jgi:hypothetical protein